MDRLCGTSARNGTTPRPNGGVWPARESGAHGPRTLGEGIQERRLAESSGPSHDVRLARVDPPRDERGHGPVVGVRGPNRGNGRDPDGPRLTSHRTPAPGAVGRPNPRSRSESTACGPVPVEPPPARHPLESLARRVGRVPRIGRDHLDWRNRIGPFAWSGSIRRPCCVISIVPSAARRRAAQRTASIQSRQAPGA